MGYLKVEEKQGIRSFTWLSALFILLHRTYKTPKCYLRFIRREYNSHC